MKISSRHTILFNILLLYSSVAYTQNQWIDSVKKVIATQNAGTDKVATLINLSNAYRFSYPDSGLVYAQKALSLAEKLNSDSLIFWSIVTVNGSLYVLGNYLLGLDYAFKALPLAEKLNTPFAISFSYGMLSDCYYNLGEYDTALRYWREVMKITEQALPDERYLVYGNSSHIFENLHQYDSALIYAKKSYELMKLNPSINKDNANIKWAKSAIYTALGDAFACKTYYDSALFYYRMSIPFSDEIHMELNKADAYNGIAKVFKEKTNLDSAVWYAKKVLVEKVIKSYPSGLLKAANLLATIYKSKNNTDSALKYLQLTLSIKDSLFNREKTIAFQNIIFKEQEKQKGIEAAKAALQNEYRMYFLIILFVIAIFIAGVIIRNRRIKQLQNMRNSIADDLHDDIGSALSSINIMNELAKSKSPEALPLLVSIGESTITIQENMSDIVWAIKSENDRFENVVQRMNRFASEMLDAKNMSLDFKSDVSLSALRLTMEQRKNVYLFFKEAINNAAKHSGAKKVSVSIVQKDHSVEMNIRDDGKGFDTTQLFSGNGMNTLKKRAGELNGDFKITSHINEGTVIQLKFKIT